MDTEKTKLHTGPEGEYKKQKNRDKSCFELPIPVRCTHLRYCMGALCFLIVTMWGGSQGILSLAIISMTSSSSTTNGNVTQIIQEEFHWDAKTQEWVLSSFGWLGWLGPIPGAYLCRITSGKSVVGITLFLISLINMISPTVAKLSAILLIVTRVFGGFLSGIIATATIHVLSDWSLNYEKTLMSSMYMSGLFVGGGFNSLLSSVAIYAFSWEAIFWISGLYGFFITVVWLLFADANPFKSKQISQEELELFNENQKLLNNTSFTKNVAWKDILTSLPVWAIVVAHFTHVYMSGTFSNDMPRYLHYIVGISAVKIGILSTLASFILLITNLPLAIALDKLILTFREKKFVRILMRKIVVSGGLFLSAVLLLIMTVTSFQETVSAVLFITIITLYHYTYLSYLSNVLDIAQQYAGIIKGLVNMIAFTANLVSPLITGLLMNDLTNQQEWNIVIYVILSVALFGTIFYAIFASAKIQDWAKKKDYDTISDEKSEKEPVK